ncbi:hypothetical protein [Bacillus mycoides]|uniref:hypothetical protein n=1 Tax=Bacillus mycoides TaxID=1405 RepID=UPI003D64DC7B
MKRIFEKVILTGALLGFVVTNVELASASSSDSDYYMEWPRGGYGEQMTPARDKENKTSAYINAHYIGNGYKLYAWVADGGGGNQSGGNYYTISAGEPRKLANLVREHGEDKARIKANLKGYSVQSIASGGVWSPDSV